jgi:hypothetical protein
MNSIRNAVPNVIPTARSRTNRLAQAALIFATVLFGAVSCADGSVTEPLTPVDRGYIDAVAPEVLKREADGSPDAPTASMSPSLSLNAASAAAAGYSVSSIPFAAETGPFIPPQGFDHGFPGTDDLTWGGSTGFPIGFNFTFFGIAYDRFWIASNGAVLFQKDPLLDGVCCNAFIPRNDPPRPEAPGSGPRNNLIAALWTDLKPLSGQVTWATRGQAPNRRLIVDFNQVPFFFCNGCMPSSSRVSVQVIIYERTNVVEIHTKSLQNLSSPAKLITQGIENATGTEAAFLSGRNAARLVSLSNDAVRFTPAAQNAVPEVRAGGNAGGPPPDHYAAVEGEPITFKGSASDADGDALAYSWDFNNDAIADATTAEASFTYADNRSYVAIFTANDGKGGVGEASANVTIRNAAPRVNAGEDIRIQVGETVNLSGTFDDPGANDNPWGWTWNVAQQAYLYAGNTSDRTAPVLGSHRFCRAGVYPAKLTVVDKDGDSGEDETMITVDALPVDIEVNPNEINLNGNGHGMIAVRIFSNATVNAATLNPDQVKLTGEKGKGTSLARTGGGLWMWNADNDENGDGRPDVVAQFRRDELVKNGDLTLDSKELRLTAPTGDCGDVLGKGAVSVKVNAKEKSAAAALQAKP